METISEHHSEPRKERGVYEIIFAGSLAQAILAAFAISLLLVSLVVMGPFVAAVAVITIGASLVFEGGTTAYRFVGVLRQTGKGILQDFEIDESVSAEFIGGIAGIVFGVLATINITPLILIPVSAIVYGITLMLGAGATYRLNNQILEGTRENELSQKLAHDAVAAAASFQVFVGLVGSALGVIAVAGIQPLPLSLAALIIIAFGRLVSGTALSNRMLYLFYR